MVRYPPHELRHGVFTNEIMRGLLASNLEPASLVDGGSQNTGTGSGSREGEFIEWLTIADQSRSAVDRGV
jgi:carbonic anhydrase